METVKPQSVFARDYGGKVSSTATNALWWKISMMGEAGQQASGNLFTSTQLSWEPKTALKNKACGERMHHMPHKKRIHR